MSDGRKPDPDLVICPACTHQFRAIPENVQASIEADREAMQMALDALTLWDDAGEAPSWHGRKEREAAIAALRERLK